MLMKSQFFTCNCHKFLKLTQEKLPVRQEKYRDNTGNLQMGFEWGPCCMDYLVSPGWTRWCALTGVQYNEG